MTNKQKISRKNFFKVIAAIISIPFTVLWFTGTKRVISTAKKKKILVPQNLSDGITFLESAIIKKDGKSLTAFSSKCTHLGCKINSTVNDNLVCPCHGSKFSFDGIPQNGPATVPLNKLEIVKDKSTGELVVYV